jgi:hypothetical protein
MNERHRRSTAGGTRARRIRPAHAASRDGGTAPRPPASPPGEQAALAFLYDILIGDRDWSLAEVRRLISMRESVERGQWHDHGSDGGALA